MSAWILGLLISARIGAAAGRDAVDEVPNFMKSARPAHGQRRLSACDYVTVFGSNHQTVRHGTYQQTGTCEGRPLYTCIDCSSTQMIWYYESYTVWYIGSDGCGSEYSGIYIYDPDEDLAAVSGTWTEWTGSEWQTNSAISVRCDGAPTAAPSMTFAPTPTPPYEYAPTVDAMPYCRLQSSSVCWGNTHRFLAVTANGPFDGIDAGSFSRPALGDLDGDGTLRRCP